MVLGVVYLTIQGGLECAPPFCPESLLNGHSRENEVCTRPHLDFKIVCPSFSKSFIHPWFLNQIIFPSNQAFLQYHVCIMQVENYLCLWSCFTQNNTFSKTKHLSVLRVITQGIFKITYIECKYFIDNKHETNNIGVHCPLLKCHYGCGCMCPGGCLGNWKKICYNSSFFCGS